MLLEHRAVRAVGQYSFQKCAQIKGNGHHDRMYSVVGCSKDREYPTLSLERSIGDKAGTDLELWGSGRFDASVYPDLPIIGHSLNDSIEKSIRGIQSEEKPGKVPFWAVRTVAAQTLGEKSIIENIRHAGNLVQYKGNDACKGALLMVSGGHPGRNLPRLNKKVKDSAYMLEQAKKLRLQGDISSEIGLWAVCNPGIDPVASLEEKVEAGAELFLTQPPFLHESCEEWFELVKERIVPNVPILAGVPMISSYNNLLFWIGLCGLDRSNSEVKVLEDSFPRCGSKVGKESNLSQEILDWNLEFMTKAIRRAGVLGAHVMPLTPTGKEMTSKLLDDSAIYSILMGE
eukprot:jgi/Picsp_1/1092/NSC_04575-R1_protein